MTRLNSKWTLSYVINKEVSENIDYEKCIHKIAEFDTVEDFWQVYSHVKRPTEIGIKDELQLFRDGYRAIWEDDVNQDGGKWYLVIKLEYTDLLWEHSVLSIIGEQFHPDVIGIVISKREAGIMSYWVKSTEERNLYKIAGSISHAIKFPSDTTLHFRYHDHTKPVIKKYQVSPPRNPKWSK